MTENSRHGNPETFYWPHVGSSVEEEEEQEQLENEEKETVRSERQDVLRRISRSKSFDEIHVYLKSCIRTIPDFPKPGMDHRDITTLLLNPDAFQAVIDAFVRRYETMNITHIASCESGGYVFGAPLALALKCAFVPIRRARRLPGQTIGVDYTVGFSTGRLECHENAVPPGARVVILDDSVATGNTLKVMFDLISQKAHGQVVECATVVNMKQYHHEKNVKELNLFSLITY